VGVWGGGGSGWGRDGGGGAGVENFYLIHFLKNVCFIIFCLYIDLLLLSIFFFFIN
jgi:hypothetical protein